MKWGPWFALNDATPWNSRWGVYRIRLVDGEAPISVPRIVAPDPDGIIYIGRSGYSTARTDRCLGQRLWEFYSHGSHSGAGTWWQAKRLLDAAARWPRRSLEASVIELADSDIDSTECAAVRAYFDVYGELPPCNSAFPGKWATFTT